MSGLEALCGVRVMSRPSTDSAGSIASVGAEPERFREILVRAVDTNPTLSAIHTSGVMGISRYTFHPLKGVNAARAEILTPTPVSRSPARRERGSDDRCSRMAVGGM